MVIKIGDTVSINGENKTIKTLTRLGTITTTDNETFDAWYDIIEERVQGSSEPHSFKTIDVEYTEKPVHVQFVKYPSCEANCQHLVINEVNPETLPL